jgi:DUF4097 and DUF4098 domain-containing protein YvlB
MVAALVMTQGAVPALAATIESNIVRTFSTRPGGTLAIDSDRGSIVISPGQSTDQVVVEVRQKISRVKEARALELLRNFEVTFAEKDGRIEVRGKSKKTGNWFRRDQGDFRVEFRVSTPIDYNLDLKTAGGSISSGDIKGNVLASTSGGGLKFGNVGGEFDGGSSAGSIVAGNISGKVRAHTSGGGIDLGELGGEANVDTSAGSIAVKAAKEKLWAKTSGGGITVGLVSGPAELESSAGSIKVHEAQGKLSAETSGGGITIDAASGPVKAHTSAGSIRCGIAEQPDGECRLTTSGGGIDLRLGDKLAFNLEASSSGGGVLPTSRSPARSGQSNAGRLERHYQWRRGDALPALHGWWHQNQQAPVIYAIRRAAGGFSHNGKASPSQTCSADGEPRRLCHQP